MVSWRAVNRSRLVCAALLLLLTCAVSVGAQDVRPAIEYGDQIYLTQALVPDRFMIQPQSSQNWPGMRHGGAENKVALELLRPAGGSSGVIKDKDIVSIRTTVTTHPGYDRLYLSKGGWIYCDTPKGQAEADEQWWTVERQAGAGEVREGDFVRFRNRYYPDRFIHLGDDGTWLTGSTNHTHWRFDLVNPKKVEVALKPTGRNSKEVIEDVIFTSSNSSQSGLAGGEMTWTISETQSVQLGEEKTSNWELGVTVGVSGNIGPVETSVEVSAAYGESLAKQRSEVKESNVQKSVTKTYTVPSKAEAFVTMRIVVPYKVYDAMSGGLTLQMRKFSGGLDDSTIDVLAIPDREEDGSITPVQLSRVERCLMLLANKDRDKAEELVENRLPVWQQKGWVTAGTPNLTPPHLAKLPGKYQRQPRENDWHDVTIEVLPRSLGAFQWSNGGGRNWRLTSSDSGTVLQTDESSPYFEEGPAAQSVVIEYRPGSGGKVTGEIARVKFRGDTFERVGNLSASSARPTTPKTELTLESLVGRYQRMPVENGWHDITINPVAGQAGAFEWKNKEGVAWKLLAQGNKPELGTDQSNPYPDDPEAQVVRIEYRSGTNEIARVWFRNEAYERVAGSAPKVTTTPSGNTKPKGNSTPSGDSKPKKGFTPVAFDPTGLWDLPEGGGRPVVLAWQNEKVLFDGKRLSLIGDQTYGVGEGDQQVRLVFIDQDTVEFQYQFNGLQKTRWVRLP
jgi:hypothetical protein